MEYTPTLFSDLILSLRKTDAVFVDMPSLNWRFTEETFHMFGKALTKLTLVDGDIPIVVRVCRDATTHDGAMHFYLDVTMFFMREGRVHEIAPTGAKEIFSRAPKKQNYFQSLAQHNFCSLESALSRAKQKTNLVRH